jgi:anti-sigma B factor antagonist
MEEDQPLTVAVNETAVGTVVKVTGEVDMATAPLLHDAVLATPASQPVVLDLSGVGFIDSSGLRVLAQLVDAGYEITVTGASEPAKAIFAITGIDQVVKLEE